MKLQLVPVNDKRKTQYAKPWDPFNCIHSCNKITKEFSIILNLIIIHNNKYLVI